MQVEPNDVRLKLMELRSHLRAGGEVDDETLVESVRLIRQGRQQAPAEKKTKAKRVGVQVSLEDLLT